MKKRLMVSLATGALMAMMLPGVASADSPTIFEGTNGPFPETDPCTGDEMLVTINWTDRVHFHKNNLVAIFSAEGTTDNGYVMTNASGRYVENKNKASEVFKDRWSNPDNGNKFEAAGKFQINFNTGEVTHEEFELRCIGRPAE